MSIKGDLIKGIGYTALSKYSGIVISFIVTAILSRLLAPSDFGTVAVASVIISFFSIIGDLGIAPAIIQNRELSKKDISALFMFTVWMAIIISFLFFISSGFIAKYYASPILDPIGKLLSLNLLFTTLNVIPNALLLKEKAFKFLAERNLIVQFLTGVIAVVTALNGAGIYALTINPVLSSMIIFFVTLHRHPQKVSLTLGIHSLKKVLSFSFFQFLFNLINFFNRNLDKLLIGKFMGMNTLGYYEKSYRLMMLPLENITHVFTPVMHPIFSELQNDKTKLEYSYLRVVRVLALIGFPLSVFLFFTAKELILLIFGQQWELSVPVFRILSLTVGIQIVLSSSGSIFQSAGDTKSLFICGLFSAFTNITGLLIAIFVFKSLNAVAWGIFITFGINFIQAYLQMYFVTFKLKINSFLRQFTHPLLLSGILFVVFLIYADNIKIDNLLLSFLVYSLIFMIISASYLLLTKQYGFVKKWKDLKE